MLYEDATKTIKNLSKSYTIKNSPVYYKVFYKHHLIFLIYKTEQFWTTMFAESKYFNSLPFSHKLYMILSELAMTPLSERSTPRKYNVIIACLVDENDYPYIAWFKVKGEHRYDIFYYSKEELLAKDEVKFTEEEYRDLIKYLKSLPDGEYQAKVAEHGKKLAEAQHE